MSDFVMQIGADLDLSKVQEQLDSIKKQKVTLDIDIKGNDDAHNLAKSIEKGLKATKIDTSGLSKQLADAFNITDKSAISKLKGQINSVMSELSKTWNGKEFNLQGGKGNAFISGLSDLANSVSQNANIIQGKMGIYDQFYSYFKDKKIYVSDDLKKALSGDDYKELLNNNIGHIVREASKGVSIDSIWGEMTSMFPEHFADNIVTQADQIKRAFEVLAQARQDMTQVISAENMTPDQAAGIKADAFDNVIAMSNQIRERLQQNIETASEGVKNTYDLDVDINTEKIVSDIRNAIQSATSGAEDAVQINVKINDEELLSQMRSAISQLATGDEPVQVDIQVNKQSLESDLEVALKDVELPIKFKIDSEQMAADIQAAVNQITDVEINLRVNTDSLRSSVERAVNSGGNSVPTIDTSGYAEMQNIINGLNSAGVQGQSVFQSFGSTLKDAFSTFTAANLLTDAIYKVGDAARDAVSTVKELDNATVALQLATGANYNTVHGMMNDYNALAKELGSLTTQVSEGADAWIRQGKSIDEVNNLVKSSMVLSKVGNMSSEDATKYLTANLNGYKLQADAAESVVDKISSVDLVSATDSAGLAEAMSRVAVTADQAGISMDRLLGYVATIGEVTQQSMSTVGTAMKSILARMTNIKSGKLELVDEDGTTEKLSDVETTLANVGINLRKTMTEYNSASDVLDALASKWDTMNQAQQNATSIAFGGQRMQNQFRILMQYYDRVQKYTDVAANSEGSGEQKFDLYLEGLEAKTNSLKASLESLSSSVISRDLYAGFLDGSKAVVDFTEKTGLLKGALAGLGTAGATYALMVTGGISVKQAQKSVVSGGNTAKATSATNADTKATTSHTKATEESTETVKKSMKTFDWVATKLETWEKKVKKISDQITDYITSALKTSLLKKQMKTMNYEMKANTKGELAYMKKANSVAEKYTYYNSDGGEINVPIPKKYQKLVQSGAYHIEDMDTSTDEGKALAEAISEYQSWYEKAQDCKQAVIDLRNEQQKLFEQWANMPTEKAEKKIDRLTTGYNGINAVSSRLTAATKGGSTQAVLAQTMKEDLAEAQDQKKSDNKALKSAKTANKKASSEKRKADNKVKSTAKSLLKTNLTDEQKKQVKSGKKLDTTGMSGSQKKKADAYNKAVTNKSKANKKATSAKSKLSTAKSNYNSSNSTYNSMKSNVNEALTAYDSGDSLSYMNSLVDQQVSGKKLEQNARKTAVEQANANVATANKQKKEADKKFAKLQKKYKNSKKLTAAQKKKIAAGKEIDTTGITDAKQLKILTAYNNALADSKKKKENVTIATNALAEANENLMTAEVESAQATVEAVSTKFDNAKTYYEALLSYQEQLSKYQEKNIDLAKAHGDYEKSSDYDTKISNTQAEMAIKQNELDELTKQLDDGVEAGTIVENSQEWLDMQTKIKEAQNAVADYDTQIEELKQSQIGVYYEEQFKRAAEKVDRFRDKLDGLKSLISDDMKIDKNTGLLTESGALSITLDVDDINASTENLKTYIKERQQIINDYNAGKFGEDEYNQKLKDVDANIKSTTANIYSSRNSILELVKSQSQAELDVLNKVIDKRKEALSAKKNYYDYDKTLKNKTKDIEVLERQIAALEGSTSAEDKARKAKLQEQLDSAKEDLNDTITDHAYSMQTDALDKLSADMSEDLDKWINTISSNMEEMTTAINDAVKNAGLSTAGTINAISSILRHYRLSDSEISQSGLTNITGYASGTNYVNKSGIYRVNEKGMESVFSKQYGTLTFLNQGDKVFDANFTKQLLDNSTIATQKNMPDYAGMAKAIEKNIQNIQNLSGNTYVNNFYIDGAQDTESILREIDKHLDKKIQAHDKKQVRDFKSLR